MSGNVHSLQVGGFLQRIDYVRKYAFGVMCILKNSEGQFPIRGFWIFRGQDIPQMMKDECYDLELYNWEKLDGKALNAVSTLTLASPHHRQGCLADLASFSTHSALACCWCLRLLIAGHACLFCQ